MTPTSKNVTKPNMDMKTKDPLQQARQRGTLRGVGAAEAPFGGGSRGLQITALRRGEVGRDLGQSCLTVRKAAGEQNFNQLSANSKSQRNNQPIR